MAYYGQNGLKGAIDRLLDYAAVDEGFSVDPMALANAKNNKLKIEAVQEWWLMRMVATRRPLQEKMTLFWHNHFATSTDKVVSPYMMLAQNQILRAGATGKFPDLLLSVSKDPAMLLWLDNQYNVKGHPNENFAREVMELFTLGIGNYTERDIQEAARAFTGWGFGSQGKRQKNQKVPRNQIFIDHSDKHDDGIKEVLGNRGNFDGDDVIGILCGNPQASRFLVRKMWSWFAYPKPEDALVERLAEPFHRGGMDIRHLVRSIMEAPEFYSESAYRAIYKNPVDFTVSTLRQLGYGERALSDESAKAEIKPATALRISTKAMGMNLLWPPDVSGWAGGQTWVSTATMVERIHWAQTIFDQATVGLKNRTFTLGAQASVLFTQDPTPEGVAKRLVSIFDAAFPDARMAQLAKAAQMTSNGRVDSNSANRTASAVARLIFASPEFQFC